MERNDKDRKILRPHEALELEPDDFAFGFAMATLAAANRLEVKNPETLGVTIIDEDGIESDINLTNIPMNRAMMGFREHFKGDQEKFQSAVWRFWALTYLISKGHLGKWVEQDPDESDSIGIHEAVIEAAAKVKLTKKGKFRRDVFLRQVERIAAEKYPED